MPAAASPHLGDQLRADRPGDRHPPGDPHRGVIHFNRFAVEIKSLAEPARLELLQQAMSYALKDDPQPHVLFTFGFSNLNPAPSSVST